MATAERADMIALGWRRRLVADLAAVVREVLARTPLPVLLLPADDGRIAGTDAGRVVPVEDR